MHILLSKNTVNFEIMTLHVSFSLATKLFKEKKYYFRLLYLRHYVKRDIQDFFGF